MIARATLALLLACPTAATVMLCPHGAAAQGRKGATLAPASKREKVFGNLQRRSRALAQRANPRRDASVVSATFDDGLAYDTPRGPDGRPVALAAAAHPIPIESGFIQRGLASWYGGKRWQGHLTSLGTPFDENAMTAAHATLPLGTQVRVRLVDSDREVVVTITDRPGTRRRIIDLSRAAAAELGILSRGIATVALEPL